MISFAAGRAGIVFFGGRIFCFLGKSCIYVFSVLCGSCVVPVSGDVCVLCKWSVVPEPGDVWVPCWCFAVTGWVQRSGRFTV